MKRTNFRFQFLAAAVVAAACAISAFAGDEKDVPAWLQQASKNTAPPYDKEVPAVVLHNDQAVNVSADGTMTVTTYYAVKLLNRNGRAVADAAAGYLQSASKVKEIRGWLMRPDGTVKFFGKDKVLDQISDPDDIYNEYRVKTIDASQDADVGSIFGYETTVEEKPLFAQDSFSFQHRLPTLYSRYTLNLPTGWQATGVAFNAADLKPTVTGARYVWELRDLAPIKPEPDGLSISNLAPRIAVSYFLTVGTANTYESWRDVSKWYTELSASSLTMDDAIAGKARDLTADAKTEIERIRLIAEYVQGLRYISLDLGVARGGGHRPRPANLVLERGYGDCKDKANLMRAMLKALKIESHLVLIYSGDPTFVKAEWASPRQFNHCIIAVRVGPDTIAPTVVDHEKLGRLMIFDATDPYTQVGDLPEHEQGSYALVAAGAEGELVKMPILSPEANRLERTGEITLGPDGSISGKISQLAFGQTASFERAKLKELSAAEYRSAMERWLSSRVAGGNLTKVTPVDKRTEGKFDLDFEFSAPAYAQIMQGRLMMFKPAMAGRLDQFVNIDGKRTTPILLDGSAYSEQMKIKLPAGFAIDEMPEPDTITTPFGKYTSKYEIADGYLLFSRKLTVNRTIIPASGYEDVRKFFGVVRNAEVSPVVLVRK
jgi:transglutaminase-like putative cysteine protease